MIVILHNSGCNILAKVVSIGTLFAANISFTCVWNVTDLGEKYKLLTADYKELTKNDN